MHKNVLKYKSVYGEGGQCAANTCMQLRKICNHPFLFPKIENEDQPSLSDLLFTESGKMQVLDKLVTKLLKEDHKILIFSQFTTMLDIIQDYCTHKDIEVSRIDGSKTLDER